MRYGSVFDETRIVSGIRQKMPRVITLPRIPPFEHSSQRPAALPKTYSTFSYKITSLTEGGARAVKLKGAKSHPLDQTKRQPYLWKRMAILTYFI